jgi:hypothetical protein
VYRLGTVFCGVGGWACKLCGMIGRIHLCRFVGFCRSFEAPAGLLLPYLILYHTVTVSCTDCGAEAFGVMHSGLCFEEVGCSEVVGCCETGVVAQFGCILAQPQDTGPLQVWLPLQTWLLAFVQCAESSRPPVALSLAFVYDASRGGDTHLQPSAWQGCLLKVRSSCGWSSVSQSSFACCVLSQSSVYPAVIL